jgi:uncharacterized protein (DUF1800 family)
MVTDPKAEAALALHRFGFGPRVGSIAAIAADPRGALLADIDRPGAGTLTAGDMHTTGEAARAAFKVREERRTARLAERAEREAAKASSAAGGNAPASGATSPQEQAMAGAPNLPRPGTNLPNPNSAAAALQQNYRDEAKVRIDAALNAEIGFAERLTWFWSNHFCVSVAKNGVRPLAGAYEREAIRPHVLGRFADMLLAAETHPAMLIYLDNARSIGPNSQADATAARA